VLVDFYNHILATGDARTANYPLVNSPKYVILAVILYLLMVIFGPRIMAKRQPFQLRGILIGYNFLSVILSVWMMWEVYYIIIILLNDNL